MKYCFQNLDKRLGRSGWLRLLQLSMAVVLVCSIIMSTFLAMSPCFLCYLDRFWLFLLLGCSFLQLNTKMIWTFSVVFSLAFITNLYHLYLIHLAPPGAACVPWLLIQFEKTVWQKLQFVGLYLSTNLSSCQQDNSQIFSLGLPTWLVLIHFYILLIFIFYTRSKNAIR